MSKIFFHSWELKRGLMHASQAIYHRATLPTPKLQKCKLHLHHKPIQQKGSLFVLFPHAHQVPRTVSYEKPIAVNICQMNE
jgi:hypothetical protein